MSRFLDLIGQKFNRLIVIKLAGKDKNGKYQWLCRCGCKNKNMIVQSGHLRSGHTQSCGCLKIEKTIKRSTKHGHNKRNRTSKTYNAWKHIKERCLNQNCKEYKYYGERGITICQKWLEFLNFLKDMGEPPTKNHTIDRKNNNRNYCKSNCRWATKKQQMRNTRRNHLITAFGKTQTMVEWTEEIGISYIALSNRINKCGWSPIKALTTPVKTKKRKT